jgi:hypothetical protein
MTAWVLIAHLASSATMFAIPGIASQQECERLNDMLIQNYPHNFRPREAPDRRATNDSRCLSYEIAPNETQAHH